MKQDFKIYLRLLSYLKPFWGIALLVLVGFAINAATEVSVAKLLKYIIDAIVSNPYTIFITVYFDFNLIQKDPDDNKFVDCAITAGARYAYSG